MKKPTAVDLAKAIVDGIPEAAKPVLLRIFAGTKYSIHRQMREFVRDSCSFTLTASMEGRVAKQVTVMLGGRKYKRRARSK